MSRPAGARRNALFDVAALLTLVGYVWIVFSAKGDKSGVALDPVWAAIQRHGALRVATDVGFRPFAFECAGELVGYDIDLARELGRRLDLETRFVPTGFDALYDALVSGRADLIASALPYAPEQGYRARFSHVYFDAGQVLATPADTPIRSAADLTGRVVGVALGSDADALARRMVRDGAQFTLRSVYDDAQAALDDLRVGRLDAVITDMATALEAIHRHPDLRIAAALTAEPLVLAMPRSAFRLEAEINRVLEDLRQEGFFTALNRRWFGETAVCHR